MPVPLEQFVEQLRASGVLAEETLNDFLPPKSEPKDAEALARNLVRQSKLTRYQAAEIYRGKGKSLVLGKYVLMERIGAGGMGQVFKAQHRRMDRLVAVKLLPWELTKDKAAIARFEREVKAAARLRHPNIVAADDADQAHGVHFLVMELVDGSDLSTLVKRNGPFSVENAVNYVLQAAQGLEAAHAEGIIHRDIKPANLLLDKKGNVKILDMGLARIHGEAGGQSDLTNTGTVMGTVDYMAPEQAVNMKSVDGRVDIYALGYTLFYLLAGKAAYGGDTLWAKILAHREQPIPDLRAICPAVPEPLQAVFQKMVAKSAEDRYQTVTEVIAALQHFGSRASETAGGQPTLGHSGDTGLLDLLDELSFAPDPVVLTKTVAHTPKLSSRWMAQRKPALLVAGVLAALVLITGLTISLRTRGDTPVVNDAGPVSGSTEVSQANVVATGTAIAAAKDALPEDLRPIQLSTSQPVSEAAAAPLATWEKLTHKLNDIASWHVASGQWSETDGRLYGEGDSKLTFQDELPSSFLLGFEMSVVKGMRPRIWFGDREFYLGNEGYDHKLYLYSPAPPIVGAHRAYRTGVTLHITCRVTETEVEFLVNGGLLARCQRVRSGPLALTLSAGDWWSKDGQVVYGPFTIGPAPPAPLAKMARGTSSDSIDLLALIDVARDLVNGDWKRENAALVSPKRPDARLLLPYSPGGDYELTLIAERVSGTQSLVVGLVIGGRQVALTLDGYGGETAGLADLDQHDAASNESTRRGRRLPPGQPHTIVCTVHGSRVRVTCDGQEALAWSGDAARLSNSKFWEVPDERRLYLGAQESEFKFTRVEVRPLPAQPTESLKEVGWTELFDGKSLTGWTGDAALMRVENGVLVNDGKRGVVVAPGDYRDFEIELEFRLANGGNSGLGICYSGDGDPSQNGLEVQMIDDDGNPGRPDNEKCGALYKVAAVQPGHFKRWPEWNRFRVTSSQDAVRVEFNGTLVTDAARSRMKQTNPQHTGVSRTSGKVCLFPIKGRSEYRDIRIRRVK
jgi:serine/threonine protein kinase